jgi:pilus assembly protein CpaE
MPEAKIDQFQLSAYLENSHDIEILRDILKGLGIKSAKISKGGIKEAITAFSTKRSPKYLIIDISKSEMPISDVSRLSDLCDPGVKLIAIGTKNDVGLYRELIKLGISDYLVSPLFSDILSRSLKNFFLGENSGKKPQTTFGKIIAFVGSRGGVGSTFLATNFADLISKEKSRRAVLVDLDMHLGTTSLYFNIKSNNGLEDALENPDRIDPQFLERLLMPVDERLSILNAEIDLSEKIGYKVEGFDIFLEYLSKQFHYVILDVPHYSNSLTRAAIAGAQIMVLVSNPSLAGLRDAGRFMRLFGEEEGERKIVFVLNKVGAYEKGEISIADFESTLNHKVNHAFEYDSQTPMESLTQGKPLVEGKSALGDSIRGLVDNVLGTPPKEEKASWFSQFFSKEN